MKDWFKNNKSKVIVIGGLVAVAFLIGLAPSSEAPGLSENETATTTSETPTGSAPKAQGASQGQVPRNSAMKLYSDKKYGFTFEYPQNYSVTALGSIVGPDGVTAIRFGAIFTTTNGEIALDDVPTYLLSRRLPGSQIEIINGYNWQKDVWFAEYYLGYSLRTGSLALGFSALKEKDEALLKQVVRSIKFVKSSESKLGETFRNLKIGDTFGSLKVSKITAGELSKLISPDNFKVEFTGQVVLRGFYDVEYHTGRTIVCVSRLDAESLAALPKLDPSHDYKNTKICFDYDNFFANSSLEQEEGNAGVVVNNFTASFSWREIPDFSANVVSVIE